MRTVLATAAAGFVAAFAGAFTAAALATRRRQVGSTVHSHNPVQTTPEQAAADVARLRAAGWWER